MQQKVDFTRQLATTSSVAGLRRSSKELSKAKITLKKGHGHCLVVYCLYDPLQLSESWQNHYIWEVFSANQWDALKTAMPAASTGQQNESNSSPQQRLTASCTINASKVEQVGLWNFASSAFFTWLLTYWPLTSDYPFFKHLDKFFAGKVLPQPEGGRKCFPRACQILKHRFYTTGINKLISHWKKCVDCNGSYFD